MRLLLDTHSLLWFALGDEQCSAAARQIIEDAANEKWVSPASHWELAIKVGLGKYTLPGPFEEFVHSAVDGNGFQTLPILPKYTSLLVQLPHHHRDPFDRMIIAQAIVEGMTVVSCDKAFDAYPVKRVW